MKSSLKNILKSSIIPAGWLLFTFIQAQDLSNLNPESITYSDTLALPDVYQKNLKSSPGEKLLDSVYFYNPDTGILAWRQTQSTLYHYNTGNLVFDKVSRYWSGRENKWKEFLKKETSYSTSDLKNEEITKAWSTEKKTWENRMKNSYSYDSLNQLSQLVTAYWNPDSLAWKDSIRYSYDFDSDGNWVMYLRETWIANPDFWRKDYRFLFSYEDGNKTRLLRQNYRTDLQNWVNSNKTVYTYDLQNRLTAETGDVWDADSTKWDPNSRIKFLYNDTGYLADKIYKAWKAEAWSHYARYNYSWDEQGNNTNIVYSVWSSVDSIWDKNAAYQYDYDADGDLIREIWKDFNHQDSTWLSTFKIDYFYSLPTYKKEQDEARLRIFPNPFTDKLTIDIETTDFFNPTPIQLRITDLNGRTLYTTTLKDARTTLNGLNLPPGIYLITLQEGKHILYKKVVRE